MKALKDAIDLLRTSIDKLNEDHGGYLNDSRCEKCQIIEQGKALIAMYDNLTPPAPKIRPTIDEAVELLELIIGQPSYHDGSKLDCTKCQKVVDARELIKRYKATVPRVASAVLRRFDMSEAKQDRYKLAVKKRLTEPSLEEVIQQRDALLAACMAAEPLLDTFATSSIKGTRHEIVLDQLRAAIALTEKKEN